MFKHNYRIVVRNKEKFVSTVGSLLLLILFLFVLIPNIHVEGSSIVNCDNYTVKSGDTLWSIASSINTNNMDIREIVFDIKDINDFSNDHIITVGEIILVPVYD